MTLRTLLFSTLYPSSIRPDHGIFVQTRLRELLGTGEVETRVVAPVPWFFSTNPCFGDYARVAATPQQEEHNGIKVFHPRYFLPPKIGMNIAPFLLAAGAIPTIKKLMREGFDFDLIDAHYVYPDGVAAAIIANHLDKPFVVTARGTDINLIPQYAIPRKLIQYALGKSAGSIGVCKALVDEMAALGTKPNKLHVLRNGVDLVKFSPIPQMEAREELSWDTGRKILLSVRYLIERKGHHLAIEALSQLPDWQLKIVGRGPEQGKLEQLALDHGVADRVTFVGQVQQDALRMYYSAADVLVLASSREGWANVLLESMACGTPVVATNIWGTPEVVSAPAAGKLMSQRTAEELVACIRGLLADYPDRQAVRKHAEDFSWQATSQGQLDLFREITSKKGAA